MRRRLDWGSLRTPARITFALILLSGLWLLHGWVLGRMTGGGSFFAEGGVRVTHGFELYCQQNGGTPPLVGPNNLEVNWDGGNHFHLETLTANSCLLGPDPTPPKAPISIYNGCGLGSYNGTPDFYACWTFVDAGEPGTSDTAWFELWNPTLTEVVLNAGPSFLTFGNHQAHFVTGGKLPSP